MKAPPDAPVRRHAQGNQVGQRAGKQAKAADVHRPGQQRRRRNVVEQQNGCRDVADELRQTDRRQPQAAGESWPTLLSS